LKERWHQPDCRPVFFEVATAKLERKSGLLTLWCDGEILGASVFKRAAGTTQLLTDMTGQMGGKKKRLKSPTF